MCCCNSPESEAAMNSMSEQWWEKKLNIRTAGKVDHFIEEACNPYEPTAIFLSFRTGCRATGIEFDQELCEEAVKNLEQSKLPGAYKKGIRFVCEDARNYQIEDEDCFYFFNPFAEEVLRAVLGRIRQSYYENPRQIYLFFYYPFEAEVAALMTADSLQFADEIDCTELYENYDRRERILIFEMV